MTATRSPRMLLVALTILLAFVAAGCDSGKGETLDNSLQSADASAPTADPGEIDADDVEPVEAESVEPDAPDAEFTGGGIDLDLDRADVDCSEDGLGSDDATSFLVAHVVVDGNLGAVCFGESDPTLISSWETLAAITPPGQLLDLGLFGGFIAGEDEEGGTTLAFVNTLDDEGSLFQMSVNLDEADANPDELLLTMAHEFSHVFTATSPQIDRSSDPDECETYFNGEGCYIEGSVLAEWIRLFWGDGLIDQIDPNDEATVDIGEERCSLNPGFFGPYAASTPEEDFGETFSVYVFDVPPTTDAQQEKLDWIDDQAGLAEFRDRAIAADLGPLENTFEPCGS